MTPERWRVVKSALATVIEVPPDERDARLAQLKADDPALHDEVRSLLLADAGHATALNDSRLQYTAGDEQAAIESWIGRRVGAYRLTGILGEGGMGAVYRAKRDDGAFELEAAVKVVRSGVSREYFLRRFRNERQILAQLDHPNIARLLDGGAAEDGAPYIVMELVEGVPIDVYCRSRHLSLRERLQLFRTVCAAVQYAHQALVVHRDLKPGNILVTAAGEPKLLDFGIASIVAAEGDASAGTDGKAGVPGTAGAIAVALGGRTLMPLMTPAFASPEQVKAEPITTASDVYSLGVILYLLLVGRLPHAIDGRSTHALIQSVCDTEPPRPSTAVATGDGEADGADNSRGDAATSDRHRDRQREAKALRGDLDAIVMQALRKIPAERYASVERFSADIGRYLDGLPTAARRGSTSYYVGKFILRHRAFVIAGVAVAAALLAATVISVRSAQIARAQQALAERRFQDVRELADTIVFDVHDAIKDLPGSTPARKLLVERVLKYLDQLSQDAASDYGLMAEVASAYERIADAQGQFLRNNLGDTDKSLASYEHAYRLRQRVAAAHPTDVDARLALARAERLIANQVWAKGDLKAALAGVNRAISIEEALPTTTPVLKELAAAYHLRATLYGNPDMGSLGSPKDASASAAQEERIVAELVRRLPDDKEIEDLHILSLVSFGETLEATGEWAKARSRYEQALRLAETRASVAPTQNLINRIGSTENHLAYVDAKLGDTVAALTVARAAIVTASKAVVMDPQNHMLKRGLAIAQVNAAAMTAVAGDHRGALQTIDAGFKILHAMLAEDPNNDRKRVELGNVYEARGDINMVGHAYAAAVADYTHAYDYMVRAGAADAADLATMELKGEALDRRGLALAAAGQMNEAEAAFKDALRLLSSPEQRAKLDNDGLTDLADAYAGIGNLEVTRARASHPTKEEFNHWSAAAVAFRSAIAVWHEIPMALHARAADGLKMDDQPSLEAKLRQCEQALEKLHRR